MRLLDFIGWYVVPYGCSCCGEPQSENIIICDECRKAIEPQPHFSVLPNEKGSLFCCISPFYYAQPLVREAIINLKFNGHKPVANEFAQYLAKMDFAIASGCDIVTSVPLSKGRKRWRGYNQSELIAMEYARLMGKEYVTVLRKLRSNKIQSLIANEKERKQNVKGMYEVCDANSVKGKKILIIDDVYTTGATMGECAKMLKKSGAARVVGMTVASAN